MPCRICGARCHGDRCAGCEQDAAAEQRSPDAETSPLDPTPVECTQCNALYQRSDDQQQCPDCGSTRRRYAGEVTA